MCILISSWKNEYIGNKICPGEHTNEETVTDVGCSNMDSDTYWGWLYRFIFNGVYPHIHSILLARFIIYYLDLLRQANMRTWRTQVSYTLV